MWYCTAEFHSLFFCLVVVVQGLKIFLERSLSSTNPWACKLYAKTIIHLKEVLKHKISIHKISIYNIKEYEKNFNHRHTLSLLQSRPSKEGLLRLEIDFLWDAESAVESAVMFYWRVLQSAEHRATDDRLTRMIRTYLKVHQNEHSHFGITWMYKKTLYKTSKTILARKITDLLWIWSSFSAKKRSLKVNLEV